MTTKALAKLRPAKVWLSNKAVTRPSKNWKPTAETTQMIELLSEIQNNQALFAPKCKAGPESGPGEAQP